MFHIDNILIAHVKANIVTKYVKKLDGVHRLIDPLTMMRGKYYEYLGIILDFKVVERAYTIT